MATEAAWLNGNNLEKEEIKKKKEKREKLEKSLDTCRPSHGRTYARSSRHIVDTVSIWFIATPLTRNILDSLSFSPVQQFSVTLWHSARLNHDYTIIAGDSARVSERV